MDTKRPAVVTIAAIVLLVMALLVAGLGLASQFGFTRGGFANRGTFFRQNGSRNFTPPSGFPQGGFNNNGLPNDQTNPGTTQNFPTNRTGFSGLARILRILRPVMIGFDILVLVLAAVAAFGIFRGKRWGMILAIVLAVLVVLLTIPSMLRIFSAIVLVESLARILLAVAVVVLLLLPASRKAFTPVENDLELDLAE